MVVVLPSGGSFLGGILFFSSIPSFWLADIIMPSPALLFDAVLTSLDLLAVAVGVAFIGLGGVMFVCTTFSPKVTIFLVLPNPTPYSELESLSSWRRFCPFLPDFFNAFSSFLIFLVSCAKFWFTGVPFFPPFLAAQKLGWFPPSNNSGKIYVNARGWTSNPQDSKPTYDQAEHFLRFLDKLVSHAVGNHFFLKWSKSNRSKNFLDKVTASDITYTILILH